MPYSLFKFIHVGSMFLATALAIGPSVLLYLIARTGTVDTVRRTFVIPRSSSGSPRPATASGSFSDS